MNGKHASIMPVQTGFYSARGCNRPRAPGT